MPSPVRRSARGAPPPNKPPPPASNASSSSLSSGRLDRSTRVVSKQKSSTPHSLSSEDFSEPPRRSQRSHHPRPEGLAADTSDAMRASRGAGDEDSERNRFTRHVENEEEEDDGEEVTRCVCGQQEYPGPPLSEAFSDTSVQSEDAGGLFISCDGCSVWQHGGCVGIVDDAHVPDKYFCEQCRPKLHSLYTDSRGQKYSLYLPLHPGKSARKQSLSKHSNERLVGEREAVAPSRLSADPATGRRRATMRSKEHDDEEAQIQRAIEESKREVETASGTRRNGKRGREELDDVKTEFKRQRRASTSLPSASRLESRDDDSDIDPADVAGRGKKARAEAAQSARQAEIREKEKEREQARAEAAGRRQERAGRRRADDPEPEETPISQIKGQSPPAAPSSQPDSPTSGPLADKAMKKGPGRKTRKLGNNQYTRQRDSSDLAAGSPHLKKRGLNMNNGGSSGDEQTANGDLSSGAKDSPNNDPPAKTKTLKGRAKANHANGTRNTLLTQDISELAVPEMARQISAMAAFLSRAQMEITGDRTPSSRDSLPIKSKTAEKSSRASDMSTQVSPDDVGGLTNSSLLQTSDDGRRFDELSAMEMADVLSKNMNIWERKFAAVAAAPTPPA